MAGTEAAFRAFAEEMWPDFVRTAVFMGCELHEAQDVAQTALVRCWQAWDRVSGARDRDSYGYRVLHNCLRDARRRPWRRETPTGELGLGGPAGDPSTNALIADLVERALRQLSPRVREAVILRHLVGLSERQTANALRIPVGTVKSRCARGLSYLSADPSLAELAEGTNT